MKKTADRIEFRVAQETIGDVTYGYVAIFINDRNLIEMLANHERPFALKEGSPNIAGNYMGPVVNAFFKTLTTPDSRDVDENGKVDVLFCSCGCEGCWPMRVSITETSTSIIWSDFEQPHRVGTWDYSDFGPFEFDKREYLLELEKLKAHRCTCSRCNQH